MKANGEGGSAGRAMAPEMLLAALESIGEAVCITDPENRLRFVNEAFRRLYGYADQELLGRSIDMLRGKATSRAAVDAVRDVTLAGTWSGELWNRRKDGTEFPIRLTTAPVKDGAGRTVALIGVCVDLSAEKATVGEQALRLATLTQLHELSLELAALPSDADLFAYLGRTLRRMAGAIVATVGEYVPDRHSILIRTVESDSSILNMFRRLTGMELHKSEFRMAPGDFTWLNGEGVAYRDSLTEISFGAIPRVAAEIIQKVFGVGRIIGITYRYEGTLYGTSVVLMRKGLPDPPRILMEAFGSLAAVSLRRHQAELKLRQSVDRYQALYQHRQILVCVIDLDGNILDVNEAGARLTGRSREELLGAKLQEWLEPSGIAELQRAMCELVGERPTEEPCLLAVRTPQGGRRLLEVEGSLLRKNGKPWAILGIGRDVTAERETAAALKESELRYRGLYMNAGVGLYRTTPDGRILDVNETMLRMVRFDSLDEMKQRNLETEGFEAGYSRAEFRARLERDGEIRGLESVWTRRDGTPVYVREHARVQRDEAGQVMYYEGTVEDITEIHEKEQERARLQEQLEQARKMESVGRLAGGVAHDFNNLLTVINGYSEMLLSQMAKTDASREPLEEIRQAGERAAELTRQLLSFSRKQMLQARPVSLRRLVEESRAMLTRMIGEDIELELRLAAGESPVVADPTQVLQILMNLAANARDAMPAGGTLTVETGERELDEAAARDVAGAQAGRYVTLQVSDDGEGMSEEVREHLFEPFFTTKGVGEGTGLGLSTVYGIVRQSGGWITVESAPGRGSRFLIGLPWTGEPLPAVVPPPQVQRAARAETVLLVEDQQEVRRLTSHLLGEYGYRVLEAKNAVEALEVEAAHEGAIDLLLTDVVMPGMNGRALAERMRERRPELRVLLMSGYSEDPVDPLPGSAFLGKPFRPDELAAAIRKLLDAGA